MSQCSSSGPPATSAGSGRGSCVQEPGAAGELRFCTGKYFLCRHCYDLVYESQRDNEMTRALRRAQVIRERLGGSANMTKPFPEKPKGMHWKAYDRLFWEHHEAEMKQLSGMREWLDKFEKKVG